jgi:acyl dehydratase
MLRATTYRRFLVKPVFIGDTIYTIRTHLQKWPKYPTLGMVRVSYEVFKMPGELVLYCEHLQTVKYRNKDQAHQDAK